MLRIGICDDESRARDALRFTMEKLIEEDRGEEIVYEFSSGLSAVKWLRGHPGEIDLIFLDVEMDGITGLDAAKEIRTFERNLILVFVTGYADFVFEGYRVQALDYLLKPVKEQKLAEVLKRAREIVMGRLEEEFTFQNPEGIYRIYRSDIRYCFSDKRRVCVKTQEKEIFLYAKLDDIQEKLGAGFVRIHQRYLVNTEAVEEIRRNSVWIAGAELPISRAQKAEATKKLAKALLRGMNK